MSLPVSIQLFGLRNAVSEDPEKTIRELAKMGYDGIEPYDGAHGMKPEEFRSLCDSLGLTVFSIHTNFYALDNDPEAQLSLFRTLGVSYAVYAGFDDGYRPGDEKFPYVKNRVCEVSKIAEKYGIGLLYHNHDFEFQKIGDECKLDYLMRVLPKDVLQTELDTCWVNIAGYDPSAYIEKYAGRCPAVHLKDFIYLDNGESAKTNASGRRSYEFRAVGDGLQDMPKILDTCVRCGAKWVVVEQDNPVDGVSELESAAQSIEYLRKTGW